MNILILESEIYLSHSIAKKLMEIGHFCTMSVKLDDIVLKNKYDVVLLSTFTNEESINSIKMMYKESIIILLASSVNHYLTKNLLQNVAVDYILKPFMITQLIDKIEHHIDYKILKKQCQSYEDYLYYNTDKEHSIKDIDNSFTFPLFLFTNNQKKADTFAFAYAEKFDTALDFIALKNIKSLQKIKNYPKDKLVYISGLHMLKDEDKNIFLDYVKNLTAIIANNNKCKVDNFSAVYLEDDNIFYSDSILTIENYTKYIINKFQDKFTDTDLSKKLGLSRKSLWEKRKKYNINRIS